MDAHPASGRLAEEAAASEFQIAQLGQTEIGSFKFLGERHLLDEVDERWLQNMAQNYSDIIFGALERHFNDVSNPTQSVDFAGLRPNLASELVEVLEGMDNLPQDTKINLRIALTAQHLPRIISVANAIARQVKIPPRGLLSISHISQQTKDLFCQLLEPLRHINAPMHSSYFRVYIQTHPEESTEFARACMLTMIVHLADKPRQRRDIILLFNFIPELVQLLPISSFKRYRNRPTSRSTLDLAVVCALMKEIRVYVSSKVFPQGVWQEIREELVSMIELLALLGRGDCMEIRQWQHDGCESASQEFYRRCQNDGCGEKTIVVCGRCKCVRYCSAECQREDWKKGGHRYQCYVPSFEGVRLAASTIPMH